MPLEPEVLTLESLSPPIVPLAGSIVMAWIKDSTDPFGYERVPVQVFYAVNGGYILVEAANSPYKREWLLAIPREEPATLETMLGYTDEEIEALAEKMKRTPRWLRWIFGKVCDFLEWLDRKI